MIHRNNSDFDKRFQDFDKNIQSKRRMFTGMFVVIGIFILLSWAFYAFVIGSVVVHVNENGGVAKSLGTFVKDFNEAKDSK